MSRLFVSHATADSDLVETEFNGLLRSLGFDIWFSKESISTGEQWERSILTGLESSQWFVIILSPESEKSQWVKAELSWAIGNLPDHIVPILIKDCNLERFHIGLPGLQYIDYRNRTNSDREKLVEYLVTREYKSLTHALSTFLDCPSKEILTLVRIEDDGRGKKGTIVGANARANKFFGRRMGQTIIGLTAVRLFDILSLWMDPDALEKFVIDQKKLTDALARGEEIYASIPMSINYQHPIDEFRGHSFFPITIAYSYPEKSGETYIEYTVVMYLDLLDVSKVVSYKAENT